MDKRSKEQVHAWAAENSWMQIGEGKTPEGYPQENYLTPAGSIVFVIYDNEGFLRNIALPMPPSPQSTPQNRFVPPGFHGGLPPGMMPPL